MQEGTRDPVTGQTTTGHDWNGIEELNTPVPRVVFFFFGLAFAFSVICWLIYPTFPLISTYTRGLFGIDQQSQVTEQVKEAAAERSDWEKDVLTKSFADIQADQALMQKVGETGRTLFQDNCAACHGVNATGGPGFPNLTSKTWLWGGDIDAIAETIRVGINSTNDDTRVSQMLAFGKDGILNQSQIRDVVAYVQSLSGTAVGAERAKAGQEVFAANCVSCHGEAGKGMTDVGAPDLTDKFWIYGGSAQAISNTVFEGRQGHMPTWEGRLSPLDRKILALYLVDLRKAGQ